MSRNVNALSDLISQSWRRNQRSDVRRCHGRCLYRHIAFVAPCTVFSLAIAIALGCRHNSEDSLPAADTPHSVSNPQTTTVVSGGGEHLHHPSLENRDYHAAIRSVVVREDPLVDGWDSEHFSDLAMVQLNLIAALFQQQKPIEAAQVRSVCHDNYTGQPLRPQRLTTIFDDPPIQVRRPSELVTSSDAQVAPQGLADSLNDQRSPLLDSQGVRTKFKIIRVGLNGSSATTTAYFELSGSHPHRRTQINATWDCNWQVDNPDGPPRLLGIEVRDYEEVDITQDDGALFADCTEAAFGDLPVLREQLIFGRDHWYANLEATIGLEGRGNGLAIGDANGDGLDDLYICQPAALPNRLFLRQADGTLRDVSQASQVDWLDSTRAAAFVDIDNDGDQDLILAQSTHVLLHENDGSGRFRLRQSIETASRLFSMNAVDFDNDRDLDIFVCGYTYASQIRPEDIFASPMPYHDANNGAPNILLRNDGHWQFYDVTEQVGLNQNNLRFSLASSWDDMDNDGDMDLYVANDFGRNNLYRNDDGHFVDVAADAGVEDIGPGMSAAWGDYDNDGHIDLYVSNMFSSAGSRITRDAKFLPGATAEDLAGFQRHARGNSLFQNLGGGRFADQSLPLGVNMGRWAWGSLFTDLNNDGWQDLYITNGFVTADENNDL